MVEYLSPNDFSGVYNEVGEISDSKSAMKGG